MRVVPRSEDQVRTHCPLAGATKRQLRQVATQKNPEQACESSRDPKTRSGPTARSRGATERQLRSSCELRHIELEQLPRKESCSSSLDHSRAASRGRAHSISFSGRVHTPEASNTLELRASREVNIARAASNTSNCEQRQSALGQLLRKESCSCSLEHCEKWRIQS